MGKHAQRGNGPKGKVWVHTRKCPDWGLNPGPPSYILGALTTKLYGPEYRVLVSDSYQLCDRLLIQHNSDTLDVWVLSQGHGHHCGQAEAILRLWRWNWERDLHASCQLCRLHILDQG